MSLGEWTISPGQNPPFWTTRQCEIMKNHVSTNVYIYPHYWGEFCPGGFCPGFVAWSPCISRLRTSKRIFIFGAIHFPVLRFQRSHLLLSDCHMHSVTNERVQKGRRRLCKARLLEEGGVTDRGQPGSATSRHGPDLVGWLVEQGLASHSTQFRSFRRRWFYRSDDPTNNVKALKEGG